MADRHMDFDAARAESEEAPGDDLSFTLCGEDWKIRGDIPGAMLMDFITSERVTQQIRSGKDLLMEAIEPDRRPAFEHALRVGKPASVMLTGDLNGLDVPELKKLGKAAGVPGYTKMSKTALVAALVGQPGGDAIPPPSMPQLDEIIAWLVRELLGRPSMR